METITKDDFLKMVRLNHLEVITQPQLYSNTQVLQSYMEKALVSELSDIEKSDANTMIEEVGQLQKWNVMRDDFTKAICYTRKEQIEWEEPVKGEFGEIVKAKGGVYKPTSENKKLGSVGQKYGEYREIAKRDSRGVREGGEKEPKDLTDSEVNKIISEFFKESGKLGRSIKNMPVNSTTEPILNKLHKRVREKGYLTEQGVFDMLSSDERKYLKKWSE